MLSQPTAVALVLLACFAVPGSSAVLRGGPGHLLPASDDAERECKTLASVPHLLARPLLPSGSSNHTGAQIAVPAFACHVAASVAKVADSSLATCSPVCDEPLDIVLVLGASEWSLEQRDIDNNRRAASELLKHYELSRARGSLFGILDVSQGAAKPTRVSPLTEDRAALLKALQAWSPKIGGEAVTALQMQGFDSRPEVLAMLDIARASVRRTLLVMQPPPKKGQGPAQKPHLLGGFVQISSEPGSLEEGEEIMELLVSTCPAVRIDPSLSCGRMRWGTAEDTTKTKIKPFGKGSSK